MESMAAKKRSSEKRQTHLGIRLTKAEADKLREAERAFPSLAKSDLVRLALMKGLDTITREGITFQPPKPRAR